MVNKKLSEKRIQQLKRLHSDIIHKKISETLRKKYASGKLINSCKGKKRPDLSERNKLNKGKSTWNKGIKGDKYLSHFKNIKLWKKNKQIAENNKTYEQKAKPGIISTLKQSKNKISQAELKIKEYLIKKDILFIHQYSYLLGVADFYIPETNTIIECYGKYWHSKPEYIIRDERKNKHLISLGYKLLILCSEEVLKCKDLSKMVNNEILNTKRTKRC